ncbi:hypothetical protein [Micromonospora yangpuensis]|uniref:Uncharacterized protein n=1 Tax=Micromonospora yangpuensis TaxID=683228 RepID=A0A1C6VEW9_9ACTN|nr:hypothetical protein [Micromonospora yangpuensis]GGM14266.1 hypothetical protein GCM10012279_35510 [Micromonospora yangpuensis]SCL64584.1 hypothetical protein GA0070617_5507 [Micromonospora yangpuensis]
MSKVRIEGMAGLRRALRRLPADVEHEGLAGLREAAEDVREDWYTSAAADTGAGREGIEVREDRRDAAVEVGIFDPGLYYMVFPEEGTKSQAAQPALAEAIARAQRRVAGTVARRISRRYR